MTAPYRGDRKLLIPYRGILRYNALPDPDAAVYCAKPQYLFFPEKVRFSRSRRYVFKPTCFKKFGLIARRAQFVIVFADIFVLEH